MTGLDRLREAAEKLVEGVRALQAENASLQAENERMREALKTAAVDLAIVHHMFGGGPVVESILATLGEGLAGSPAANEETKR